MADGGLLSLLAQAQDPTAEQQARAYEAQRAGELSLGSPGGIFGGLVNALALGQMNRVPGIVGDIAAQRQAALPELAQAYGSPDPYAWAAAHQQANPIVLSRLLGGSPSDVIGMRKTLSDIELQRLAAERARLNLAPYEPGGALAPGSTAASPGVTPLPKAGTPLPTSGRYAGGGGVLDLSQVPKEQRAQYLQSLDPTRRAIVLSRFRRAQLAARTAATTPTTTPATTPATVPVIPPIVAGGPLPGM